MRKPKPKPKTPTPKNNKTKQKKKKWDSMGGPQPKQEKNQTKKKTEETKTKKNTDLGPYGGSPTKTKKKTQIWDPRGESSAFSSLSFFFFFGLVSLILDFFGFGWGPPMGS
jgi:hypothetical protein